LIFKVFGAPEKVVAEVAAFEIGGVFKVGSLKLLCGSAKLSNPIRLGELSVQEPSFKQTATWLSARNCSDTDPEPCCVQQI